MFEIDGNGSKERKLLFQFKPKVCKLLFWQHRRKGFCLLSSLAMKKVVYIMTIPNTENHSTYNQTSTTKLNIHHSKIMALYLVGSERSELLWVSKTCWNHYWRLLPIMEKWKKNYQNMPKETYKWFSKFRETLDLLGCSILPNIFTKYLCLVISISIGHP